MTRENDSKDLPSSKSVLQGYSSSLTLGDEMYHRGTPQRAQSHDSPSRWSGSGSPERPTHFSQWHKTSFKIGKQKPSKARHLTKSELIGLVLSALVSFLVSSSFVALVYYGGPVVFEQLLSMLGVSELSSSNDPVMLQEMDSSRSSHSRQNSQSIFRFQHIKSYPNMSASIFTKHYHNKLPAVFSAIDEQSCHIDAEAESSQQCRFSHNRLTMLSTSSIQLPLLSMTEFQHSMSNRSQQVSSDHATVAVTRLMSEIVPDEAKNCRPDGCVVVDSTSPKQLNLTPVTLGLDKGIAELFDGESMLSVQRGDEWSLSSSAIHSHKSSLHYQLQGERDWVFFKYDARLAFHPDHSLHRLLQENSLVPTNSNRNSDSNQALQQGQLMSLHQSAGEWVSVPEGWMQASLTPESSPVSIGVSFYSKVASPNSFLKYLLEAAQRLHQGDAEGAVRLCKLGLALNRNPQLLSVYADALVHSNSFLAAEDVLRELLEWNPLNPRTYGRLINLLIQHGTRDVSQNIGELLELANRYQLKDEVLSLAHDSI